MRALAHHTTTRHMSVTAVCGRPQPGRRSALSCIHFNPSSYALACYRFVARKTNVNVASTTPNFTKYHHEHRHYVQRKVRRLFASLHDAPADKLHRFHRFSKASQSKFLFMCQPLRKSMPRDDNNGRAYQHVARKYWPACSAYRRRQQISSPNNARSQLRRSVDACV